MKFRILALFVLFGSLLIASVPVKCNDSFVKNLTNNQNVIGLAAGSIGTTLGILMLRAGINLILESNSSHFPKDLATSVIGGVIALHGEKYFKNGINIVSNSLQDLLRSSIKNSN